MQQPAINPNKSIALFCPSSPVADKNKVFQAQEYLEDKLKLRTQLNKETYSKTSAQERAKIVLDYLFDENIGTLWALRGGEGSADLIPHLHKHQKRIAKLAPKTIISFSDGSALINYFSQTYNWPCWHGITALQVQPGYLHASNVKTSLDILLKAKPLLIKNLKPLNETAKTNRLIKGKLTGGNLSLLNISIGDLWEIDTKNKIVFIEEVNEKAHVIIRTLKYLQRIGKFKQAKAILFGDFSFSRQGQTKEQQAINRALNYFASTCSIPVLQTKQFGHGKYNTPLPLGQQLEIDLNQCCLTAL